LDVRDVEVGVHAPVPSTQPKVDVENVMVAADTVLPMDRIDTAPISVAIERRELTIFMMTLLAR
jgi:hypothetical protein